MTILDWEGIVLIIAAGDICKYISEYFMILSSNLNVIVCVRSLTINNDIYIDLENDYSFTYFENNYHFLNILNYTLQFNWLSLQKFSKIRRKFCILIALILLRIFRLILLLQF